MTETSNAELSDSLKEIQQQHAKLANGALTRLKYKYEQLETKGIFMLPFKGSIYVIDLTVFVGSSYLVFHAALPAAISKEAFPHLTALANKNNVSTAVGNFEVESDNNFRFRIGISIPPFPNDDLFENYLTTAVGGIDQISKEVSEIVGAHPAKLL